MASLGFGLARRLRRGDRGTNEGDRTGIEDELFELFMVLVPEFAAEFSGDHLVGVFGFHDAFLWLF